MSYNVINGTEDIMKVELPVMKVPRKCGSRKLVYTVLIKYTGIDQKVKNIQFKIIIRKGNHVLKIIMRDNKSDHCFPVIIHLLLLEVRQ